MKVRKAVVFKKPLEDSRILLFQNRKAFLDKAVIRFMV